MKNYALIDFDFQRETLLVREDGHSHIKALLLELVATRFSYAWDLNDLNRRWRKRRFGLSKIRHGFKRAKKESQAGVEITYRDVT